MRKLIVWDKERTLYPPVGDPYTKEKMFKEWSWTANPNIVVVIEEPGGIFQAIYNLEILKNDYNIETDDVDEAIALIEAEFNKPAPPVNPDDMPMTTSDAKMLGEILTEIQLNTMEV